MTTDVSYITAHGSQLYRHRVLQVSGNEVFKLEAEKAVECWCQGPGAIPGESAEEPQE